MKSGHEILPALLFFPKTALVIQCPLCFHTNFRIFIHLCEKCCLNFDTDCIESVDCFGYCGHVSNNNTSNSWVWNIFLFTCISFNFFHQCLIVSYLFKLNILCLLWLWLHNIFLSSKYVIFNHFLRKMQLIFSLIQYFL